MFSTPKIPVMAILNKQKCHFFFLTKSKHRRAEPLLSVGLVPVAGERMRGKGVRG
jgi:hypothetical protein